MGTMETESRKRTKRHQLQKMVLQTVQAAGLISIAIVAPNVVGAMGKLGMLPSPRQNDVVNRATGRLVRAGLLEWHERKLRLTSKGEKQLRLLALNDYKLKKPRRWDQKWRVISFDIPEKRRALRQKLAYTLQEIGFQRLQNSVWVYPYDCEDLMALLKADFKVGDDVRYMIVDMIERDEKIRAHFEL